MKELVRQAHCGDARRVCALGAWREQCALQFYSLFVLVLPVHALESSWTSLLLLADLCGAVCLFVYLIVII